MITISMSLSDSPSSIEKIGVLFDEDLANYVENVFAFFPFRSAQPFVLFNAGQPRGVIT